MTLIYFLFALSFPFFHGLLSVVIENLLSLNKITRLRI